MPSGFTSPTAMVGPIGACFMYDSWYVAESFFFADASVAAASPLVAPLFITGVDFQSASFLRYSYSFALPGSPFQSVHFVSPASCCAAWIASHSVGATTPTRFPFTMTCEFGYLVLSSLPTDARVEPSVLGCTIRPCSIPGRRTSVAQSALADTFAWMAELGNDL